MTDRAHIGNHGRRLAPRTPGYCPVLNKVSILVNTRKPDRRVERTRSQLHEALLALVVERGYDSITVQDILDRANIGRSTFYLHFRDKDELLLSGMEPLREALARIVKARSGERPGEYLSFMPAFFSHAEFYREAYKALAGPTRIIAEQTIYAMLNELIYEDLKGRPRAGISGLPLEAVISCVSGAVMGIVAWWIEQKPSPPPDEVNRICLAILRPALAKIYG